MGLQVVTPDTPHVDFEGLVRLSDEGGASIDSVSEHAEGAGGGLVRGGRKEGAGKGGEGQQEEEAKAEKDGEDAATGDRGEGHVTAPSKSTRRSANSTARGGSPTRERPVRSRRLPWPMSVGTTVRRREGERVARTLLDRPPTP